MKKIELTQGKVAIVSDTDHASLARHQWCAIWKPDSGAFYAARSGGKGRNQVLMHRQILNVSDPKILVDHKNHNTLDNRRTNIRACTSTQNQRNRKGPQKNSSSGMRGVSRVRRNGTFQACISVDRKNIWLGAFSSAEEAATMYAFASIWYFGPFSGEVV